MKRNACLSKLTFELAKIFLLSSLLACSITTQLEESKDYQKTAFNKATTTKFLGNIWGSSSEPPKFSQYWNQVTPENAGKWGEVERTRDQMNWGTLDAIYNYAKQKGFPFKFHTLVWGSQQPSWISSLSTSEQLAEIEEWFSNVAARYPNIDMIDVVNEPLHAPPDYRNALGGDGSTGWDWVIKAFQMARKYFPNSILLVNDYGIITDPSAAQRYTNLIMILKNRGLVDGIGIQCHYFNLDSGNTNTMKQVLSILSSTGLPIYVSELDITGDDQTQLQRYKEKFPILWEHPNVKGITLWGYVQGTTWVSDSYLLRSDGTERPALTWLMQYVKGSSSSSSSVSSSFSVSSSSSTSSSSSSISSSSSVSSSSSSISSSSSSSSTASQTPYSGVIQLPGTVQAENFDNGGQNVAYYDTTTGNSGGAYRTTDVDIEATSDTGGGYNVGWIANGEWLEYTVNVAQSGTYNIEVRVASINSGRTFRIEFNGVDKTGTLTVPNTGGWQNWQTITKTGVSLSAGQQIMRIYSMGDGFNINWVRVTSTSSSSSSSSRSSSSSVSSSSSSRSSSSSSVSSSSSSSSSNGQYVEKTAPFSFDGAGTYYWKMANIPNYINSWNLDSLVINGVELKNVWVSSANLPAKQNGYYYITYKGSYPWSHFEAK